MGLFAMFKNGVMRGAFVLLGAALIFSFQNCGSPKSLFSINASGGGNGEGYGGMDSRVGTFYRIQPNFACGSSSPVARGIAATIAITKPDSVLNIEQTDSCTGARTSLSESNISFSEDNHSLSVNNQVFGKFSEPPDLSNPDVMRPYIQCVSKGMISVNPSPDTQQRKLVLSTNDSGTYEGLVSLISIHSDSTRQMVEKRSSVTFSSPGNWLFTGLGWAAEVAPIVGSGPTAGTLETPVLGYTGVFYFSMDCVVD